MSPCIVCVTGKKKSGKTTLVVGLVEELRRRGHSVGTVKHDAHGFEMDREGTDTWKHKRAGAETVVISSPARVGMVMDVPRELRLDELAELFFQDKDFLVAEGFFRSGKPRLEVFRPEAHDTPLPPEGGGPLLALVADHDPGTGVPRIGLNDLAGAADLVEELGRSGKRG